MQNGLSIFEQSKELSFIKNLIETASHPIVVAVVAEGCDEFKGQFLTNFEEKLYAQPRSVHYHILCYSEEGMPFPRPSTKAVYYFAPKNYTPLFFRQGSQALSVESDVAIAYSMIDGANYIDAAFDPDTKMQYIKTEEMLKTENVANYPSVFQQARNFAKEMWNTGKTASKGFPILTDAETAYKRLTICQGCEFFKDNSRCEKCGCYMKTKAQLTTSTCPLNKW